MKINMKRFAKDLSNKIGKKFLRDAVVMEGYIDIINGDTVIHGKNSIVDQGLIGMINFLSGQQDSDQGYFSQGWPTLHITALSYMIIGSDTSSPTTHSTTSLTTPIGPSPGTLASTQSGITSNPTDSQWQVQWSATWGAGTVSGILGETGLYLRFTQGTLATFGTSFSANSTLFFSRMASADGKFTAFTINTSVPLSVTWIFRLTYAT